MNNPSIEEIPGTAPDLAAMLSEAGLPTDDLAEPGRRFFRFSEGGRTVGFIGWEAGEGGHALLRSAVVTPTRRGHGDGSQIIRWALTRLAELGFTDAWILTTTIEALAARLGFARADRAQAPGTIRHSRQFAQLCPSTAVLLHRRLP
ncbi:MAG: GNAT family N-acetyltransferase [Bacteroidales bacterium]